MKRLLLFAILPLLMGAAEIVGLKTHYMDQLGIDTIGMAGINFPYSHTACGMSSMGRDKSTWSIKLSPNWKYVDCPQCLFMRDSKPIKMCKPYWTQLDDIPWLYVNSDGTRLRIYTGTSKDYIEATITTHGTATVEKAVRILKPLIKTK